MNVLINVSHVLAYWPSTWEQVEKSVAPEWHEQYTRGFNCSGASEIAEILLKEKISSMTNCLVNLP